MSSPSCDTYQSWLSAYLDGALEAPQQAELDAHLAGCPTCASKLSVLTQLVGTLRTLEPIEPSPSLRASVMAKLSASPQAASRQAWWAAWLVPSRTVAVALTAVLVVMAVAIPVSFRRLADSRKPYSSSELRLLDGLKGSSDSVGTQYDSRVSERLNEDEGQLSQSFSGSGQLAAMGPQAPAIDTPSPASEASSMTDSAFTFTGEISRTESLQETKSQEWAHWSATSAPAKIQLQWVVADPSVAVSHLTEWLAQRPEVAFTSANERLTIQVPTTLYSTLLSHLREAGSVVWGGSAGGMSELAKKEEIVSDERTATGVLLQPLESADRNLQDIVTVEITVTSPSSP